MGCFASVPDANWEAKCITKAAFDLNVSQENIKCLKRWKGVGQDVFILQVGTNMYRYERIGSIFKNVVYIPPYVQNETGMGKPSTHKIISLVAFDLNIDPSQVTMVRFREGLGDGDFILHVQGRYLKYIKMGSCYMPSNQKMI